MEPKNLPRTLVKAGVKRYILSLMSQPEAIRQQRIERLSRWQWLQPIVEDVKQELGLVTPIASDSEPLGPAVTGVQQFPSIYPRIACQQKDPLNCDLCYPIAPEAISSPDTRQWCQFCQFPALLPNQQKLGDATNTYRIETFWRRRGTGRLYRATQLGNSQPIILKEYLLPKQYYNSTEVWQHKQAFKNAAGLNLADGRMQEFRVLSPIVAIADERENRCYLILDDRNRFPSLNEYLLRGAMSQGDVYLVLHQVLQTLEFLHGQKFRLPSGVVQTGIPHGNIDLDSLLIEVLSPIGRMTNTMEFLIYLCDLSQWERWFDPAYITATASSPATDLFAQDLIALGYVAFYLLVGKATSETNEPLNPRENRYWQTTDSFFKLFILRLMGIEPPFESAEAARRVFTQIPQPLMMPLVEPSLEPTPDTEEKPKVSRPLIIGLSLLGLGVLAGLLWLFWPRSKSEPAIASTLCCLKDVGGIPPGKFTYTAVQDGTWSYVLQKPDLIQKDQTLEQRLQDQSKLRLQFKAVETLSEAIAQVQAGKVDFAIIPLLMDLPNDLTSDVIAYDGLAVLVPFSYSERQGGLPTRLQGKITLTQLQHIYRGKIFDWRDLVPGKALPTNVYLPDNPEVVAALEQKVLPPGQTLAQVSNLAQNPAQQLPEFAMMRRLIQDFESRQQGGIGLSSISKVVGQCSVYPLAIQDKEQSAVQPISLNTGEAINPSINLCNRKGSYQAQANLFKTGRYPLAYPIAIVYSRANNRPSAGEKLAELLKTREGQQLLEKTGLVPLE